MVHRKKNTYALFSGEITHFILVYNVKGVLNVKGPFFVTHHACNSAESEQLCFQPINLTVVAVVTSYEFCAVCVKTFNAAFITLIRSNRFFKHRIT